MDVILVNSSATFISTSYPDKNFFNCGYLLAGSNESWCGSCYILIKFIKSWFDGYTDVKSVKLRLALDNTDGVSCNKINGSAFSIMSQFDVKTVTYNTKPSVAKVASSKFSKDIKDNFLDIDITNVAKKYIKNNSFNKITGIILKIENDDNEVIKFKNSSSGDKKLMPKIIIQGERNCISKVEVVKVKTENKRFRNLVTVEKTVSELTNVEIFDKYTYFITNEGEEVCYVQIEVSGDGKKWAQDSGPLPILGGESIDIVPMVYSKYSRLIYYTKQGSTNVYVVFQGKV